MPANHSAPGGATGIQSAANAPNNPAAPQLATVQGPAAMASFSQGLATSWSDPRYQYGVLPAKVGAQIAHRLGIKIELIPPDHSTKQHASSKRLRSESFDYGFNEADANLMAPEGSPLRKGTPCPTHVKAGATVVQGVIDGTRAGYFQKNEKRRPPEAAALKYACTHPTCVGRRWDTVEALRTDQAHPDDEMLKGGMAHIYYGVIEWEDPETKEGILILVAPIG